MNSGILLLRAGLNVVLRNSIFFLIPGLAYGRKKLVKQNMV